MTAALDPQAQAALDRLAEDAVDQAALDDAAWIAAYRGQLRGFRRLQGEPVALPAIDEESCSVEGGRITLRLYRPDRATASPTVVFLHGGGFIGGGLDTHDVPLRDLAARSGWLVAAVDYRLAPEFPFPAAPEDGYAALLHLRAHAERLGVDPDRLAIAGDSCGGLLAVAVALMARDRAGPALRLHAALYPNTDLREDRAYPSLARYDGNVVTLDELHRGLRLYMRDADRADPRASPLLAPDLSRLPPGLVVTCEGDPLRDEGEAYAARLAAAGVATEHVRLPGMIHGVFQVAGAVDAGRALIKRLAAALNRVSAGAAAGG